MALELTSGSALEYAAILYGNMTPEMAADYLRQKRICVRSFSQTLRQMYEGKDLTERLIDFYQKIHPGSRRSSISKNTHNWLKGQNTPSAREDYFCIAFALGLSEGQLNFLLGLCTDYAVQYRDEREAVLAWFLRNGYTYFDALSFLAGSADRLSEADALGGMSENRISDPNTGAGGKPENKESPGDVKSVKRISREASRLTHEIRNEFQMAATIEELRECCSRNAGRFGQLHLRSYYYFEQYLDLLIHPFPASGKPVPGGRPGRDAEPDYSIDRIMDTYLHLQMPSSRKRENLSLVQKLIKNNWPNATKLKNIRNHVDDVPRKLLLLLYVITENSDSREEYRELDEDYITLEERVEDHWWTLNAMLMECGMAPLDLRNAFDWLILYAICADGEEAMRDRLEGVIAELFRGAAP